MQLLTNFTYLFFSFIMIAAAHAENSGSAIIPEFIVKRDAADPAAAAAAGNGNAAAAAGNGNAALGGGGAAGDDGTTDTDSATTAWLTLTTNGVLTTVGTKFHQSFLSSHTTADVSVPAGSIGLGSHSGTVGVIESQNIVTVSSSGAAMMNGQFLDNNGGMCACLLAVIGAFIV